MFKFILFFAGISSLVFAEANQEDSHSSSSTLIRQVNFIDYSDPTRNNVDYFSLEAWRLGWYAFNQAPELLPFFACLQKDYKIDTLIETGTFVGSTTVAFSALFKNVYTIDVNQKFYKIAQNYLKDYSNVRCILGSSEFVLKQILPSLQGQRVLFYLDAHWESHWPLLQELEEIAKTHKDNCVIVIDDFKVPGRPDIDYDKYGNDECSLEYIKDKISKVFSSYTVEFLIPRSVHSKAKAVIAPTLLAPERLKSKTS